MRWLTAGVGRGKGRLGLTNVAESGEGRRLQDDEALAHLNILSFRKVSTSLMCARVSMSWSVRTRCLRGDRDIEEEGPCRVGVMTTL